MKLRTRPVIRLIVLAVWFSLVFVLSTMPVQAAYIGQAIPNDSDAIKNSTEIDITVNGQGDGYYLFEDPCRSTRLYINIKEKTFRFISPDGYDSGIIRARRMWLRNGRITTWHNTRKLSFVCRADIDEDQCLGVLRDRRNHR